MFVYVSAEQTDGWRALSGLVPMFVDLNNLSLETHTDAMFRMENECNINSTEYKQISLLQTVVCYIACTVQSLGLVICFLQMF